MYYHITYDDSDKNSTKFFSCGIEQINDWENYQWNMGKHVDYGNRVIKWFTDSKIEPNDYPRTGSGFHILISSKIKEVLEKHGVQNIQLIPSIIERSKTMQYTKYYALNITSKIDCLDLINSKYQELNINNFTIYNFRKIVIDCTKIDKDTKVFIIDKCEMVRLYHESIIHDLIKANVKSLRYIKPEDYEF